MNEFDKKLKEIIEQKHYSANELGWLKTQAAMKTSFAKLLALKIIGAVSFVGVVSVALVMNFSSSNEPKPDSISSAASSNLDSTMDNQANLNPSVVNESAIENKTEGEKAVSTRIPKAVRQPVAIQKSNTYPSQLNGSSMQAKEGYTKKKPFLSNASSRAESFSKESAVKRFTGSKYAGLTLPKYSSLKKVSLTKNTRPSNMSPIDLGPRDKRERREFDVYVSSYLNNSINFRGETFDKGNLQNSAYGIGAEYYGRLKGNMYLGGGLNYNVNSFSQTYTEESESYSLVTFSGWSIDSLFAGRGYVFDPITETWQEKDTTYHYFYTFQETLIIDTIVTLLNTEKQNTINVVSVPLNLKYKFEFSRFEIEPSIGLNASYIKSARLIVTDPKEKQLIEYSAEDLDRFNLGLQGSMNITYKLNKSTALLLGANYTNSNLFLSKTNRAGVEGYQTKLGLRMYLY